MWTGIINAGTKLATSVGGMINKGREIRKGNVEKREQRAADKQANALSQFKGEFIPPTNWFDSLINGLNRTPRPTIANGTVGLFIYAFVNPKGFSETMKALDEVPPELWWLLSSIVVFYFGARELKYSRDNKMAHRQMDNASNTASTPKGTRKGSSPQQANKRVGGSSNKNRGDNPAVADIHNIMDEAQKREK